MMIDIIKATDDLAMLKGDPPYNIPSNICYGDGYYAASLERRYGMSIEELERIVKKGNRNVSSTEIINYDVDLPAKMKADEFQDPDFFAKVEKLVKDEIEKAGKFDPKNEDDRAKAKSLALKISKTKTALEAHAKTITTDWRAKIDGVNKTRNRFVSLLDGLRDEVKGPSVEFEKELKRQEDAYKERIANLRALGEVGIDATSAIIKQRLNTLSEVVIDSTWGEFETAARDAYASASAALNGALKITEDREAQAAELEKLKAQQAQDQSAHPIERAVEMHKDQPPAKEASDGEKISAMREARDYLTGPLGIDVAIATSVLNAIANGQVPHVSFN